MSENEIISYIIAGAAVNLLLIGWVVSIATSSSRKNKYMEAQITLLCEIAKAQGVPAEKIEGILNSVRHA